LKLSSIFLQIEVVFHFPTNWGLLPFTSKLRSSSILPNNSGHLPLTNIMRSSSILPNNEGHLPFPKIWD
jgi:hypothetical protein